VDSLTTEGSHVKRLLLAAVVAALALPLCAAVSAKYRDWGASPQAYYMTTAERAQWDAITNDDEAKAFVDKFLASRGPKFEAEVADRVARADQYFTIGKTPGSKSLRGKVIILLGPPSAIDIVNEADTHVHRDNPESAGAMTGGTASSGGGGGKGGGGADMASGASYGSSMVSVNSTRKYHFTYANPKLDVIVPADANTGRDLPLRKADKAALDAAFEEAAQASIKK
jgi:GWxTD domain-containing protein